jgi:inner membrane protein
MASAVTHAVFGAAIGVMAARPLGYRGAGVFKLALLGALLGVAPDGDVITFGFVDYEHFLGHRGFFHSPFFYGLIAATTALAWRQSSSVEDDAGRRRQGWVFAGMVFAALCSHSLLDALTTGGEGVMLYFPFDSGRHFLPWRPIAVAPLSPSAFFGEWGLRVLVSEAPWLVAAVFTATSVRVIQNVFGRAASAGESGRSGDGG